MLLGPAALLVLLILLTVLLVVVLVVRPSVTAGDGGKVLAFVALFVLPVMDALMVAGSHMQRAKQTSFCLSCHVMTSYGKSLYVDDKSYVPASHFQNARISRDQACYTCHADYVLYGDLKAKLRGVRHLYVQYLGTIPAKIKLYSPYNNRECLHCHAGSRSFEEASAHAKTPDMLARIESNQLSCMSQRCHDTIHDIESLESAPIWKGAE